MKANGSISKTWPDVPSYRLQVAEPVRFFFEALDQKGRRICANNLAKLAQGPYPRRGSGGKERIAVRGEEVFRLHIGRRFTAFYVALEKERTVRVFELLPVDQAHKKYGYK